MKIEQKHRPQKFRDAWLQTHEFKTWLSNVVDDKFKARCKVCNITFKAELTVIKNHMKSKGHQRRPLSAQPAINQYLQTTDKVKTNKKAVQKLEIKLCGFLAEHNISFTVLNHLTTLIKETVTDSEIVRQMQLKSTKGAAIVNQVLGQSEINHLQEKLKSCFFSVLIDESTDISGIQTMCIIVR